MMMQGSKGFDQITEQTKTYIEARSKYKDENNRKNEQDTIF